MKIKISQKAVEKLLNHYRTIDNKELVKFYTRVLKEMSETT